MPRCKVGDIAIVTRGPCAGTLVEVLSWRGVSRISGLTDMWNVRLLNSVGRVAALRADGAVDRVSAYAGEETGCSDSILTPLPKDPDQETNDTKEPIHEQV